MATKTVTMTEAEWSQHRGDYDGVCSHCGAIRDGGTEPDARRYQCEDCGQRAVYGMEMALVMGYVDIIDDYDDDEEPCPDDPDGMHHIGCGCDGRGQ